MPSLEQNKENVQAFYDLMFNQCKPHEAIELYAGDEYRQHNPHVADGKEAFIDYFQRMANIGNTLINNELFKVFASKWLGKCPEEGVNCS